MNIFIVGSGGREHALAWKLRQSPKVQEIFVAPGNAGTSLIAQNIPVSKTKEIIDWLRENPVDLVVIGPDEYLADGIVDKLEAIGVPVFGPTKQASEIEWSKSFAKQLMKEEGIPTASYEIFNNIRSARMYVKTQNFPLVIKANGLAAGKGVVIVYTLEEAEQALIEIMLDKTFGIAGNEIVIEEFLDGREISVHAFCDGSHAALFPSSEDHKRIFDGDKGPNTGGMGTVAPVPWVTQRDMKEIEEKVIIPIIAALKKRGRQFTGILFPGIMLTKNGPKVIEFNARFGDPETQSYMRLLETDLADILLSCIHGNLENQKIRWSRKSACCIICASSGYPGRYETGKIIEGLRSNRKSIVFHAGTKFKSERIVTNGGRVLGITATGDNISKALSKAYKAITSISFIGMSYRKDIGNKSI